MNHTIPQLPFTKFRLQYYETFSDAGELEFGSFNYDCDIIKSMNRPVYDHLLAKMSHSNGMTFWSEEWKSFRKQIIMMPFKTFWIKAIVSMAIDGVNL